MELTKQRRAGDLPSMLSTAQGHSLIPLSHVPTSRIPPLPHLSPAVPQPLSGSREAGFRVDPRLHVAHIRGGRQLERPAAQAAMEDGDPGQPAPTQKHSLRSAAPAPTRSPSRPGGPRRPPELPAGMRGGVAGPRGEAVAAPAPVTWSRPVPSRRHSHAAAHKGPLAAAAAPHTGKGRDRAAAGGRGSP